MSFPNINMLWAHTLLDALVINGTRRVVISPGSRSTPLALAAHAHPGLECVLHTDERSAGFFALGLSLADGVPAALICTSGTAAANYFPAVIEASHARVPLVVLSADRPPSLRQVGASQTIQQLGLYGDAVRRFQDLPLPSESLVALQRMASLVALATAAAQGQPPGPVHLNVPFEEPLAPVEQRPELIASLALALKSAPRWVKPVSLAPQDALEEVALRLAQAERPLIVAGPGIKETGGVALLQWAALAKVPLIADVGSGLRSLPPHGAFICHGADVFLRSETMAPDLVIRVGQEPTSKGLLTYLARHRPSTICLQPDLEGRDPEALAERVVVGDVADMAQRLGALSRDGNGAAWRDRLLLAEARVDALKREPALWPQEARAVKEAVAALSEQGALCLSNSLPVRHADTYLGADDLFGLETFVFRGASGIDGVTSLALGIGCARQKPTLLVIGDLAFLHDLGGLQAARTLQTPFVILILNNDGGGIFSLLPVKDTAPPSAFEELFGTPQGLHFASAAALFGLNYVHATTAKTVHAATLDAMAHPGVTIIEFPSVRAETAASHQAFIAAFPQATIEALWVGTPQ
jgi:2-succinyl-5-enolpyruvyl-6-hydroxy-3-cyclohexene-1-carboxylate synthase